ncbi:hypothetical protein DO97_12190 [Neosynechococcus sphagnicola sy1]|uniref:Uncharacterized protein n=1 Tax=Neosynechococcus sphagnicola sy1 TaxID=1497020 RepID=A0A098TJ72_9CYAN|nr:poly-beta-1,6-N-acetyl-D-glucosamine biosynthesis protein PgaD [Neosynechococcus sphagnicola]KGF72101.1 hypothetical protein DO97_12190 [Neosynechococcus sphagnicola sy1]
MTSKTLIIDRHGHIGWQRRLLSELATATLWGGWLSLWRPVLKNLLSLKRWSIFKSPLAVKFCFLGLSTAWGSGGAVVVLMVVIVISGRLVRRRWEKEAKLEQAQALNPEPSLSEYAQHFQISEAQVFRGQHLKCCYIYHDRGGQITAIVPMIPEHRSQTSSDLSNLEGREASPVLDVEDGSQTASRR